MSRRYGRNQKRRHREEIARLTQELVSVKEFFSYVSADFRRARRTIDDMVEIIESVCKYSIAIPPKKEFGTTARDYYRVGVDRKNREVDGSRPSDLYRTIDLYALRVFLESRRAQFQLAVHLEYAAGPHSAYMISEEALRTMPTEIFMKEFVPHIGRELIKHLRGGE